MTKNPPRDIEKELIDITDRLLKEAGETQQREIRLDASLQRLGIDSLGRAELFRRIEKKFECNGARPHSGRSRNPK